MDQPDSDTPPISRLNLDPTFKAQVKRLHNLTVYSRWLVVGISWLTLGLLSLLNWRYEVSLMRSYFTWSALRYSIVFNPLPALGLSLCIGMTLSVLIWQSRNILLGLPEQEQRNLEQHVHRISQQGKSHPLWKWVCKH